MNRADEAASGAELSTESEDEEEEEETTFRNANHTAGLEVGT